MSDADEMRALTVQQPHAWALVTGCKDVENRSWRFPYSTPRTIAVHAGAKYDAAGLRVDVEVPDGLPRGAVVGFVDVVESHHSRECHRPSHASATVCGGYCSPWAAPGGYHWTLRSARVLDPVVPTRGYLWLFVPPPDVTARLTAALRG